MLLGACAPTRTGATLDQLNKKVGGPGSKSRIVVVRDSAIQLFDSGWQVYLDGAVMGDLKTGTYVYRDTRPGAHKLMFSQPGDLARASTHTFTAAPGRTYVYRLELNSKGQMVRSSGAVAGVAGLLIASAIAHSADERGHFDFRLLDGDEAAKVLASSHLSD